MDKAEAYRVLNGFVIGGVAHDGQLLKEAIQVMAKNGSYTSIRKYNFSINGQSADRFDTEILAFCNYWTKRNESFKYFYSPVHVKAMIGVESKMGTFDGYGHGKTDVMQCLDKRNPAIYCMAKIAPSNGVPYDFNEGLSKGMVDYGYQAVRNIFNGSTPDHTLVNPTLSICFGILWLGFKTAGKTIEAGVSAYNGDGDSDYLSKVRSIVNNPQNIFTI